MSPYIVTIVLALTVLFGLLSLAPVLKGPKDVDSFDSATAPKTKAAH